MLTASVSGWSPAGDDDDDVSIAQDMHFMTIAPLRSSSNSFLSPICPPLEPTPPKVYPPQLQSMSLTPSTGLPKTSIAPSSDRRAQRNRNRDPSWIPRPRNAFIIFRCEYSRDHSQGSQESQNDSDSTNPSVRTLSKRAADAWKQLPAPERERYKLLADKEREEHARLYPNYRFRPMKRQASSSRRMSCERSLGPRVTSLERPPAPSTHLPSVLTSAPVMARSSPSVERSEVSAPVPQTTVAPLPGLSSYSIDSQAKPQAPLSLDFDDSLFYSSPGATLPSESLPPTSVELFSPFCTSTGGIPDSFRYDDSAFGLDPMHDDLESADALAAYALGLYKYDVFSPFPFPEYS